MKQFLLFASLILTFSFFVSCGGNPEQEGDQAYAAGKYSRALSYYLEVKKSQPNNPKINEKIALTYMHKGLDLYQKRKNLAAFTGNFERGLEFIPEGNTSDSFKKEYSQLLYQIAMAYHNTPPANEIQKEQYFTKTLDYLEDALFYDENNSDARKALDDIKKANFQQTFDKGMKFYKQAKKEKSNLDLYLTAEFYFKRAVSFDPDNADAQKYLRKVRRKTLSILDYNWDFPFGVADKEYSGKHLLIAFSGINNTTEPFTFDPAKLKLYTRDGAEVSLDPEHTAKFKDGLTKPVELKPRQRIDGTVAYKISKRTAVDYLGYELEDGTVLKKYFP